MGPAEARKFCQRDDSGKSLPLASRSAGLRAAMTQLGMSASPFRRILELARAIADLEGAPDAGNVLEEQARGLLKKAGAKVDGARVRTPSSFGRVGDTGCAVSGSAL